MENPNSFIPATKAQAWVDELYSRCNFCTAEVERITTVDATCLLKLRNGTTKVVRRATVSKIILGLLLARRPSYTPQLKRRVSMNKDQLGLSARQKRILMSDKEIVNERRVA